MGRCRCFRGEVCKQYKTSFAKPPCRPLAPSGAAILSVHSRLDNGCAPDYDNAVLAKGLIDTGTIHDDFETYRIDGKRQFRIVPSR